MKNQALFSSKYKSKKLKCRLLQFLFGALRVNFPDLDSSQFQKPCKRFLPVYILFIFFPDHCLPSYF